MTTLLILRHAKSSWDDPSLSDHERPLNERGKRDAGRIGRLLAEQGLVPDRIISSTARRARKTAAKVAKACGFSGDLVLEDRLYEAYPERIIEVLRETGDECPTVLVVAHNPGLQELVRHLAGRWETMPTATLAQVSLNIDRWLDLAVPPGGQLVRIWRPTELE